MIVLSYITASAILKSFQEGKSSYAATLDLGISREQVGLSEIGVTFPDGQKVSWERLKKILKDDKKCYVVLDNNISPIVIHSAETGWVRTLFPTESAPTTKAAGILMHRIKNVDPIEDTKLKIKALGFLKRAEVLDTATGLGYSAIEASRTGAKVTTVELDPAALEIAKYNPYSKKLFNNNNIEQIIDDIREVIKDFADESFTHVLHDPPTFQLAGELYSEEFYRELCRVLRRRGRLFHYIGDYNSELGQRIYPGVMKRLKSVGFRNIEIHQDAFGVSAEK